MSENIYDQLPESVVLDGMDYHNKLSKHQLGFNLCKEDKEAIIESLISKFVSVNDPDVREFHVDVPDFNRMRDTSIKDDPTRMKALMTTVKAIEQDMYCQLSLHKVFEENNQFSFMFDRMLGKDIVIFKLPH